MASTMENAGNRMMTLMMTMMLMMIFEKCFDAKG